MTPQLETWVFACSVVFLVGMLMVVASAVPAVQRRYPRVLLHGFLVAIGSFGLVIAGALLIG